MQCIRVLALILLVLLAKGCSSGASGNPPENQPTNTTTTLIPNSPVVVAQPLQAQQDITRIQQLLGQAGLLGKFQSWQGKALIVKYVSTTTPHQLRYYGFESLYPRQLGQVQAPGDPGFFNPASTVKVSITALALEQLRQLELSRQTEYRASNSNTWYRVDEDIRRMLVISDNEATNRLILWLGFNTINQRLQHKGLGELLISRLMLDRGTLVTSPAFTLRWQGREQTQPPQAVTISPTCYEVARRVGNCATASALVGVFIRLVQPELFSPEQRFNLRDQDRHWLQSILSRTPRQEGFNYPDEYCRFLSQLQKNIAQPPGRMLSKCGVALFSNTYVDTSWLETSAGEKYYIVLAVTPPKSTPDAQVLTQINTIVGYLLPRIP